MPLASHGPKRPGEVCPHGAGPGHQDMEFDMANIKSAIKRNRQNEKRRQRNQAVSSQMKTFTKRALAAAGTDEEAESMRIAVKHIDKAASKGIIHKNAAARKKSRLAAAVKNAASTES